MARIRTVKPEMFESEDLASVDVTAERTFVGSLTLADDKGRVRDHPAILAGRLWALRPQHTPAHVAQDLEQLDEAGLICRYTGCNGRSYFHIITWERHQKIDRPSASRLPRCPHHQTQLECGGCQGKYCPQHSSFPTPTSAPPEPAPAPADDLDSVHPRRGLDRTHSPDSPTEGGRVPQARTVPWVPADPPGPPPPPSEDAAAGQADFGEDSTKARRSLDEGSTPEPRILDPGSFLMGREAPAPPTVTGSVSAKELVAEYVGACLHRPPKDTLGHLGRKVRVLLDEGFEPEPIRTALERLRTKGLHPSVLPSVVNEVLNADPQPAFAASGGGPWASASSNGPGYTPYFNPTAPAPTTFGGRR